MSLRVLYAVCDTGFGHRAAAMAIQNALQDELPDDVDSTIVDVYSDGGGPLLKHAPATYAILTRALLPLFNLIYISTNRAAARKVLSPVIRLLTVRKLSRLIDSHQPDVVVVCNPFYMGDAVGAARRRSGARYKIVVAISDPVRVHDSWFSTAADMHFVPEHAPESITHDRGLPCTDYPFPTRAEFLQPGPDRAQARAELGIDPRRPVVLVTAGGAGAGKSRQWRRAVQELAADLKPVVLVAPGANKRMARGLKKHAVGAEIRVLDPRRSLSLPMRASSVVVAKAGPATIFESAAVGVPLILFDEVGPQERGNVALAEQLRIGERITDANALCATIRGSELTGRRPQPHLAAGAVRVAAWVRDHRRTLIAVGALPHRPAEVPSKQVA